jgi:hypothetical protein
VAGATKRLKMNEAKTKQAKTKQAETTVGRETEAEAVLQRLWVRERGR